MKPYRFNKDKDIWLKEKRGIGFFEIIEAIKKRDIVEVSNHPNRKKYPRQKIYLVQLHNYIFSVPFIEEEDYFFLKTIIPSRKNTKKYLKNYKLLDKK